MRTISSILLTGIFLFFTQIMSAQNFSEGELMLKNTWKLYSINGKNVSTQKMNLRFDTKNRVASFKICNNFSGNYEIFLERKIIEFKQMAGTMKWCSNDTIQEVERKITNLFARNFAFYDIDQNELHLTDADGNIYIWTNEAHERQMAYLSETKWLLIQMNGENKVYDQTLEFDFDKKDHSIYGHSGCNNYFGSIKINDRDFKTGSIMGTRRACVDQDKNRQEATFLQLLSDKSLTFDIAEQVLNIYDGDKLILMFRKISKKD